MLADIVVTYFSEQGAPMFAHERSTLSTVAQAIAEVKNVKFGGCYDPARDRSRDVFFVPNDTLTQDEAARLGIHSANALYGGVVPYPFVKTKAITHDLISSGAIRPEGWSCHFADVARDAVLPGYTVFSADDARLAASHLLKRGAVRVKQPLGDGGHGQSKIITIRELDELLEKVSPMKIADYGLVLEINLRPVITRSVGQIMIGDCMMIAYYGTQRTVTNNAGRPVYGGSHLVCVRGGWAALENLPMDPDIRRAVVQAQSYDRAANEYPGFLASRRNYDIGQGLDEQGRWRSGVLEASWRSGGASTAELAAFRAFQRDPALGMVEASAVKKFGRSCKAPREAIVHFHSDDPEEGPILRYTVVRRPRIKRREKPGSAPRLTHVLETTIPSGEVR